MLLEIDNFKAIKVHAPSEDVAAALDDLIEGFEFFASFGLLYANADDLQDFAAKVDELETRIEAALDTQSDWEFAEEELQKVIAAVADKLDVSFSARICRDASSRAVKSN